MGIQTINLNDFLKGEKIRFRAKGKTTLTETVGNSAKYTANTELILTDTRVIFLNLSVEKNIVDILTLKPMVVVIQTIPINRLAFNLIRRTVKLDMPVKQSSLHYALFFQEYENKCVDFECSLEKQTEFKKLLGVED